MRRRLVIMLMSSFSVCYAQGQNTMQDVERFSRTMKQIANQVKSLGVPDELFASELFIRVYESPQTWLSSASQLTGRQDLTTHEKLIMGYAMQRLPWEQYVTFLSAMVDSVEAGITDIAVLENTAFAPFNFGTQTLIMKYQQPRVRGLLTRLMNLKRWPEARKAYIRDRVLTGRAQQEYLDFMDSIGRPVRE